MAKRRPARKCKTCSCYQSQHQAVSQTINGKKKVVYYGKCLNMVCFIHCKMYEGEAVT